MRGLMLVTLFALPLVAAAAPFPWTPPAPTINVVTETHGIVIIHADNLGKTPQLRRVREYPAHKECPGFFSSGPCTVANGAVEDGVSITRLDEHTCRISERSVELFAVDRLHAEGGSPFLKPDIRTHAWTIACPLSYDLERSS